MRGKAYRRCGEEEGKKKKRKKMLSNNTQKKKIDRETKGTQQQQKKKKEEEEETHRKSRAKAKCHEERANIYIHTHTYIWCSQDGFSAPLKGAKVKVSAELLTH